MSMYDIMLDSPEAAGSAHLADVEAAQGRRSWVAPEDHGRVLLPATGHRIINNEGDSTGRGP